VHPLRSGRRATLRFWLALLGVACGGCGGGNAASVDAGQTAETGGADGLNGYFIAADIDGRTRVSTHNIDAVLANAILVWATAEASTESSQWYFNIQLPAPPTLPHTAMCATNNMYVDFRDREVAPERWFASRPTSTCAVTFVAPAQTGTLEGTFTATLRLVGTTSDYAVTNGQFRLPLTP
jgi:hypothetical protein